MTGLAGVARFVLAATVFSIAPLAGAGDKPRILWERDLVDQAYGGPVVGGDSIFLALADETVRAFSVADGRQEWKAAIGSAPQTAVAYAQGVVLIVDSRRKMRAFSAKTGAPLWEAPLRGQASSGIGAGEGVACVGEGNKSCSAFDLKDGKPLWQVVVLGDVVSAPYVGEDSVVFGSTGHKMYAVAKISGEELKEVVLTGEVYGRIGADATGASDRPVFAAVGTHDSGIHAFSPSWKKLWSEKCRGVVRAAPLVIGRGIYAGTDEALLYGFDRDRGRIRWQIGIGGPVVERLVPLKGRLVVGAGGAVKFVNPRKGRIEHVVELDGIVQGLDAGADRVVAVTGERKLVAIGTKSLDEAAEEKKEVSVASVVVEPNSINLRRDEKTVLTFALMKALPLTVDVVDVRGRRVRQLTERKRAWPDTYRFTWDGLDDTGVKVLPGVYRIRVRAGGQEVGVGVDVVGRR